MAEKGSVEDKVDKLLLVMLEVVRTTATIIEQQAVISEQNEEIIEKLNNINTGGDGFNYEG